MSREVTLVLPDGYEDTTHVVLVAPDDVVGAMVRGNRVGASRYVHVLRVEGDTTTTVEEVGGGALAAGLRIAGQVIRKDATQTGIRRTGGTGNEAVR